MYSITVIDALGLVKKNTADIVRIAQCYLAAMLVVLGPSALRSNDRKYAAEKLKKKDYHGLFIDRYTAFLSLYARALGITKIKDPALFGNLEETTYSLFIMSERLKRSKRRNNKITMTKHQKAHMRAVIDHARGDSEFLSVFYRHILSPILGEHKGKK